MWMMAARVREQDEEWAKWRREARKVPEPIEGLYMGHVPIAGVQPKAVEEGVSAVSYLGDEREEKRRKVVGFETEEEAKAGQPLGVYEAHSHLIHYRSDTQPMGTSSTSAGRFASAGARSRTHLSPKGSKKSAF
ncbi:hypothetical protein D9611_009305 [Ephemerocybe angulata]|uniref:Uncharacterized protein n=1 Tax=Ephemerocybe angulata TaxID=980116 RepID=A0A8H5BGS4_9AGAR|nr:hypothetical protein D9611_009305 [Tulosesus angulatus]